MSKINVSIIGITGYTGMELLRCLLQHPHVNLKYLVSRQHDGTPIKELFPRLAHIEDIPAITNTDHETVAKDSDVVFLCLPHKAAQEVVPTFLGKTKIIDFSADFRLSNKDVYQKYYHIDHQHPELLDGQFIYGLPEIFKEQIAKADAVANPGCFALLVQLMLYPFKDNMNSAEVIAISGTSGGGRSARDPVDHPYCAQNIRSYLVNNHRHTPEILATSGLNEDQLNFAPTVGPFLRGIHATAFIHSDYIPSDGFYKDAPFVRMSDKVELTHVVSTNFVDLNFTKSHGDTMIVQGALDNLLRGASGTAVQNMNIMFGFDEIEGLNFNTPFYP